MLQNAMRVAMLGIGLSVLLLSFLGTTVRGQEQGTGFKIEKLAWLSGDWETAPGRTQTDEHWSGVAGASLIGMSRTVAGGKTVFFEFLRIETRGDEIYYMAHPKARNPGTEFKLVRLSGTEAVFENPEHDFPKRIIYRKNEDGTLTARIEGDGSEKEKPQEFHFRKQ
ncbi:MAG TPA: DUF6265 family protein [Pyrinomonadaceae bacterium]|nr:DUF6265 family protein [Pyrinomonadaceae bacterium]